MDKIMKQMQGKKVSKTKKVVEVTFANEENKSLADFLLKSPDGNQIFYLSKNSRDLEKRVRKFHKSKGMPKRFWDFEDDNDEGIDWVTWSDLYNNLKK